MKNVLFTEETLGVDVPKMEEISSTLHGDVCVAELEEGALLIILHNYEMAPVERKFVYAVFGTRTDGVDTLWSFRAMTLEELRSEPLAEGIWHRIEPLAEGIWYRIEPYPASTWAKNGSEVYVAETPWWTVVRVRRPDQEEVYIVQIRTVVEHQW